LNIKRSLVWVIVNYVLFEILCSKNYFQKFFYLWFRLDAVTFDLLLFIVCDILSIFLLSDICKKHYTYSSNSLLFRNKFSTYERLLPAFRTEDQICTFAFFESVLTQFNCQCFWRWHIVIAVTVALDTVHRLRQISSAFWRTGLSPASSEMVRGKSALKGPPE
jgi:hypothetical protein